MSKVYDSKVKTENIQCFQDCCFTNKILKYLELDSSNTRNVKWQKGKTRLKYKIYCPLTVVCLTILSMVLYCSCSAQFGFHAERVAKH